MHRVREAWRMDPGTRFALLAIVGGVLFQGVLVLGSVLRWW